jgi:hypothetical protein
VPAAFDTIAQGAAVDVRLSCPLHDRQGLSVDREEMVGTFVVLLLSRSGPPNIAWLVVSIVVDAIDLMPWRRPQPHVGQEILELVPAFAHGDPASTVVFVLFVIWVAAARMHVAPRMVFGGNLPTSRVPVDSTPLDPHFHIQAPARARGTSHHVVFVDFDLVPVVATKEPSLAATTAALLHHADGGQSSKALASDVDVRSHVKTRFAGGFQQEFYSQRYQVAGPAFPRSIGDYLPGSPHKSRPSRIAPGLAPPGPGLGAGAGVLTGQRDSLRTWPRLFHVSRPDFRPDGRRARRLASLGRFSALGAPESARAADPDAAFRNGLTAFNEGAYASALAAWIPLADAGDARAQSGLGFMYYSGRGVPRDSRRAAEFLERAAEQGEPTAQLFLSVMHFKSDGVPRNPPLAIMWAELAIAGGQTGAFEWHALIMQSVTEAERQEGWRLVTRWRESHRINGTAR